MSEVAEASAPAVVPVAGVVSVTQGARLAGCSRSTLNRKLTSGEISKAQGGGVPLGELERVFGRLSLPNDDADPGTASGTSQDVSVGHPGTAESVSEPADMTVWALRQVERLQAQNDALLSRLADRDEALAKAHEQRAEEVRETNDRWGRELAATRALLAAPAAKPEPVSRGFWSRWLG